MYKTVKISDLGLAQAQTEYEFYKKSVEKLARQGYSALSAIYARRAEILTEHIKKLTD